jgi:hypothetical protein
MRENDNDEGMRRVLSILNHLFLLERKIEKLESATSLQRHTERIVEEFAELGFITENPIGQPYNETRTDCEASIAGESPDNLVIVEVAKPLVRHRDRESTRIIQRAVVIVESNGPMPEATSGVVTEIQVDDAPPRQVDVTQDVSTGNDDVQHSDPFTEETEMISSEVSSTVESDENRETLDSHSEKMDESQSEVRHDDGDAGSDVPMVEVSDMGESDSSDEVNAYADSEERGKGIESVTDEVPAKVIEDEMVSSDTAEIDEEAVHNSADSRGKSILEMLRGIWDRLTKRSHE